MRAMWSVAVLALSFVHAAPSFAACMARPVIDANGVSHEMMLPVLSSEMPAYAAKQFKETSCTLPPARLALASADMCRLATVGGQAAQNRFEQVMGEQPSRMCASSKAALAAAGIAPVAPSTPPSPPADMRGTR